MANPKYTYALTSPEREAFNLYDHYVPREGHYSSWFMYVLKRLGEDKGIYFDDKYEIKVPQKYEDPFVFLTQKLGDKKVITLNTQGSCRYFSPQVLVKIIQLLKVEIPQC
jgi:hypothetical protein